MNTLPKRTTLLVIAQAGLVLMVGLLAAQNLTLKKRLASTRAFNLRATEPAVGTRLPALNGFTVDSAPIALTYDEQTKPTLLYVFTPGCPNCALTWPAWLTLDKELTQQVRVFAVDMSSTVTADYLSSHGMRASAVIAKPDPRSWATYLFSLVPRTMLIDRDGTLRKVWTGVLQQSDVLEARRVVAQISHP